MDVDQFLLEDLKLKVDFLVICQGNRPLCQETCHAPRPL
jgi:hypothetical protein